MLKGNSSWAELQEVQMVIHFSWQKKWPGVQLCTDSFAMARGLVNGQIFGRDMIGKLVKRPGEKICG